MDVDAKVKQRLGPEQWQAVMDQQRSSGQSAVAYCGEHGLSIWQFRYWKKRLSASSEGSIGFSRVHIAAPVPPVQLWIEVGSWRVGVGAGFEEATLRRVLSVLDKP